MLFKRLHLQLTALCALISIAILAVFTILYLSVSEHSLRTNLALTFQHDFDTLISSLEQQPTLTHQFLLRMEQTNDYMIFLWDNEKPLTFNRIKSHEPYAEIAQSIYENYLEETAAAISAGSTSASILLSHDDRLNSGIGYIYTGQMNAAERILALQRNEGLVLLVISPNTDFHSRILQQRILFLLLSLAGCLLLTLSAWLFTGRMLRPLRENQEKQLAFISGASHELRTPLAVIVSAVEARPPHFEETVKAEALRMGRLVEELLTLSRLDRSRYYDKKNDKYSRLLCTEAVEPDTFLMNFYEQTEHYVSAWGKKLKLKLPNETIPSICADTDKLHQLLEILMQNAIAYSSQDGVITLSMTTVPSGYVCFQISDNGIGIPDSEKDKIFERFYRVDSAHHSKEHFGLGLSIAKEIMDIHHGQIRVADTPGGGATFICSFPV